MEICCQGGRKWKEFGNHWFTRNSGPISLLILYTWPHLKIKGESLSKPRWTMGCRVMPPLFRNLSTRWRWMVSLKPRLLYARGGTRFPLNRNLDGPPSRFSHFEEERNFMSLPGAEPLDRPARSLVTTVTMLPQLHLKLKLYFEISYECKQHPTRIN